MTRDETDYARTDSEPTETPLLNIDRRNTLKLLGSIPLTGGALSTLPSVVRAQARTPVQTFTGNINVSGFFGAGVAVERTGDFALVAAPLEDKGTVYVFQSDGGSWSEKQKLNPSDPLGSVLGIEGNMLLIGTPEDNERASGAGAVYVYDRGAGEESWKVQQKLFAPIGDANADDGFGSSIGIDGNTALVGAQRDSEEGRFAGAAYVHKFNGVIWNDKQKLTGSDTTKKDRFGSSVAVVGSTALVGAPRYSKDADNAGAVYVFNRRDDGFWYQEYSITPSNPATSGSFGNAIELTSDEQTAIIGAFRDNDQAPNAGAAYVFENDEFSDSWSEAQKLTAENPEQDDRFGADIALLDDTAIIGALGDSVDGSEAGAAYVFENDGAEWKRSERLVSGTPESDDNFGIGVALGGTTGLVGASKVDKGTQGSVGEAHVFDRVRTLGPQLQVSDTRLIQVVEDTVLRNPSGSNTAVNKVPPVVFGRNTAALFDLSTKNLDLIPSDETIEFTVESQSFNGSSTSSFELTRKQVQQLAKPSTEPRKFFDSLPDDKLPVFGEGQAFQEVTIKVDADIDDDDEPEFSGTSQLTDSVVPIARTSMEPLTVGFIEIGDPANGGNYGSSNNGRIKGDFDDMVSEMREYLRDTYPIDEINIHVVDGVLNDRQTLDTTPNFFVGGGELGDLRDAHSAVENTFPNVDFDVTVAVVPEGYPNYHDDGWLGINYYASNASVAVRGDLTTDSPGEGQLDQVIAQEVGHHFLGDVYPDNLSMRDGNGNIDNAHARTEPDGANNTPDNQFIESVAYDLTDGTYDLVGRNLESFMSYNFNDYPTWTDTVAYSKLVDSRLNKPLEDPGSGPMIDGMARLESDGTATFTNVHKREGSPKTSVPGGAVTVTVRDATDGVLDERTYPDHVEVHRMTKDTERSHGTLEDLFTFTVPFPEKTATIEVERDGTVTQLNPVERSLREAIERLPDEAFKRPPDDRREAFNDKLDSIDEMMSKEKYHSARLKMEKDIHDKIEKWLEDDYETGPLQPTKQELLALADEMIARLEKLAQASGGNKGGNNRGKRNSGNS